MNRNSRAAAFLVLATLAWCRLAHGQTSQTEANEKLDYRIALRSSQKTPRRILSLRVWLPRAEPTLENLVKLCQLLRVRFYKYPRLEIQIFASEEAAKKFIDLYEFGEYEKYYPALRGHYWLDRSTGEEYLEYSEGPKPSQKTNETSPHSTSATARAVDQN